MSDECEPHRQIVLGINAPGIVEFKPSGSKPPVIEIDTRAHFQTTEGNEDRNVLIEWARSVAVKLNFGIIIGKSDFGDNRRKPYFMLVCERSGTYVSKGKKLKTEKTGTRKCQCPFRLRGYLHVTDNKWYMTVVNGTHNHELDKGLEGHLIVGRLKRNEKETMDELTRNLVAPKNILATLKERDPENKTNQRQIYNARYRLKVSTRASMTEMQYLFKKFAEKNYFFKTRSVDQEGTPVVQDIFFAHPRSISARAKTYLRGV
ncbi:protein FAR1-RELATED SEQUENCE [Trifolium repens]|nr:protein FAR1-RELATED SEQUENCE [Trifolium repens]